MFRRKTLLTVLILIVLTVSALFSSAFAEDGKVVTFQFRVDRNTIFARYGVTFYLDGKELAHIGQGDRATVLALIDGYDHVLTMVPDKKSAETKVWVLNGITDGTLVVCRLQTHEGYLELREERIEIGGGVTYARLDENVKIALEAFGIKAEITPPNN